MIYKKKRKGIQYFKERCFLYYKDRNNILIYKILEKYFL